MNATPPPPLAGRYVLIDQIGAGGMGSVWRAWDLRTERFLAAKLLTHTDGGMLLRFVREQSVRIQHPHVVAPSGWAAEDHQVVFTMDLVRGGSVHTLLGDHGALPADYTSVVLDQALQALVAVHEAGVVHRDVKPANLLLEPTGTGRPHVRLGDFGIAALMDDVRLTMHPGAIGTEGYMAPEQRLGASPAPQQDLYALGVVGIHMLTGIGPRHQHGVPAGPLQGWLTWLTQPDPEQRPSSAVAALQALRSIGVPPGTPWRDRPEPPEVFDHLRDVAPPSVASGPNSWPSGPASGQTLPDRPGSTPTPPAHYRDAVPDPSGHRGTLIAALACFLGAIALAVTALVLLIGGGDEAGGSSAQQGDSVCDLVPTELQERISADSGRLELLSLGRESFVTCEVDSMTSFGYGVKVREDGESLADIAGSGATPLSGLGDEAVRASDGGMNDLIVARKGDVVVLVRNELVGNTGAAQRPASLSEEVARALLETATSQRVAAITAVRVADGCLPADAPAIVDAIGPVTLARGGTTDGATYCMYASEGDLRVLLTGESGTHARDRFALGAESDSGPAVEVTGAIESPRTNDLDSAADIAWLAAEDQYFQVSVSTDHEGEGLRHAAAVAEELVLHS